MKRFFYAVSVCLCLFFLAVPPAESQDDYTVVSTPYGPQVCIGVWTPPQGLGQQGTCDGQLVGIPQLTAISSNQTANRLGQLLNVMSSIDQKLDINNALLNQLIEVTVAAQQAAVQKETLRRTITQRFAALPPELLQDPAVNEELDNLKKDILVEIEKRYPATSAPAAQ